MNLYETDVWRFLRTLELEVWSFSAAWPLEFGAFPSRL